MKRSALGIAAVCVAILLPCALGPAQASATVLCSVQKATCGAGNVYQRGRVVEASVTKVGFSEIVTELGTVTCQENRFGVTLMGIGGPGSSPFGPATEFVFNKCTAPAGGGTVNCTVKPVNLGTTEAEKYLTSFTANAKSPGNGQMSIGASSLGLMGYTVVCPAPTEINCTFEGAPNLTFTGGPVTTTPGTIAGTPSMTPKKGGVKCPAMAATWKLKWEITSPLPVFLEPE